jgi:outer membrane protein assembly factor BamB
MTDTAPQDDTSAAPAPVAPRRGARHKWFPILLVVLASIPWIRRGGLDGVFMVHHLWIARGTIALLSGWFLLFGWFEFWRRLVLFTIVWLLLIGQGIALRPINDGALAIVDWRFRFARLEELGKQGVAENWHTTENDFPRFLGNGPWAEVTGVRLETDWRSHPPQEVWRRPIGEGWSSFAVVGDYAVTQEQRGDVELVSCYRVKDGEPVWSHGDRTRFGPVDVRGSVGGIGPRATPTIHGDKVITQGASGLVNCLDARTGEVLWSHDTVAELGVNVPEWGKSCSPLVVDDMVIISAGAPDGRAARENFDSSLVAYDLETGKVQWATGSRQASYASPVLATLGGERQILVVHEKYVSGHRVSDGAVLWEHPWADEHDTNASASQPVPLAGDRVFLSKGYGKGASLLAITRNDADLWEARPLWTPALIPVMKTKMNNVVVRDGNVYGLDDALLQCIELESGAVQWKKRRRPPFGYGQLLLVGDVILVLTESGELVAVEVSPERYNELASIQMLDPGEVTWNNPVFAPPFLLARNSSEAVCYRLPLAE